MTLLDPTGLLADLDAIRRSGMTPDQRRRDKRAQALHEAGLAATAAGAAVVVTLPWLVGVFVLARAALGRSR